MNENNLYIYCTECDKDITLETVYFDPDTGKPYCEGCNEDMV